MCSIEASSICNLASVVLAWLEKIWRIRSTLSQTCKLGFINAGEKPKEAAVRELYDSVKIRAYEKDLEQAGVMNLFTLRPDGVRERTLTITIFICENFQGVPHMTSGFKPRWFNLSSIPYNDMFEDTKEWLGRVMSGEKVVIEIISTTDEQTNITKVKDVLVRNIFEK